MDSQTHRIVQGDHVTELGDTLRSARQKRNIILPDVAQATRIKLSYLEALENGDYAQLPGPAYITGFLRNYARYLGLHPDEVVEEYYAGRAAPQPTVKAATRVLASGHERHNRRRLFWTLAAVVLLMVGAFSIKQYSDSSAHAYTPPLSVTPADLGTAPLHPTAPVKHRLVRVRLRAVAPVWIRVKVDGTRRYEGILRWRDGSRQWVGRHTIYVVTYNGAHLKVTYNGRPRGFMATQPGLTVDVASPSGWQNAA